MSENRPSLRELLKGETAAAKVGRAAADEQRAAARLRHSQFGDADAGHPLPSDTPPPDSPGAWRRHEYDQRHSQTSADSQTEAARIDAENLAKATGGTSGSDGTE